MPRRIKPKNVSRHVSNSASPPIHDDDEHEPGMLLKTIDVVLQYRGSIRSIPRAKPYCKHYRNLPAKIADTIQLLRSEFLNRLRLLDRDGLHRRCDWFSCCYGKLQADSASTDLRQLTRYDCI